MAQRFKQGDIIHIQFNPSVGKEMKDDHYALVVSPNEFHSLGLHIVCPISGGTANVARNTGYLVSLMNCGLRTDGSVHVHHVKSLDLKARKANYIEEVTDYLLEDVLNKLEGLFIRP